jgi:hypothetical protein
MSPSQTELTTDSSEESQQSTEEGPESTEQASLRSARAKLDKADYDNVGCTLTEAEFRALLKELARIEGHPCPACLQSAKNILQEAGQVLTAANVSAILNGLQPPVEQSSTPSSADSMDLEYSLDFLILLGDYAGRLWKCLRKSAVILDLDLPDRVGTLRDFLRDDRDMDGLWTLDLQHCVDYMREEGCQVTLEMARLAIDIYAARNEACHAKIGDPSIAHDRRLLGRTIDENIRELRRILPGRLKDSRKDLEALMNFYRDSRDWLAELNDREESHHQLAPAELPPPAETNDAFRGRRSGYVSPVKSRFVSPSKRTASGSLKLARDDPTSFRPSDPVDESLHVSNGIREDIAKLN